jgi:hypothetical protein
LQIALKGTAMSSPLHLDVLVVPYKPIVGLIPPMSKGEAPWPPTSVSLISGERDAVLIDAALTPEDASRVVDWTSSGTSRSRPTARWGLAGTSPTRR